MIGVDPDGVWRTATTSSPAAATTARSGARRRGGGATFVDARATADPALCLNSDLAANLTGQNIAVDSGHLLLPGADPAGTDA